MGDRITEEIPPDEAASAVALLDRAEALWRGDFLADLTHTDWVANVARVIEAEREAATELRLRARVAALPDATEVVPELIALNERRPDWSGPVHDLMLALYRCGRTAEALEVHARHLEYRSGHSRPGPRGRDAHALDSLADRMRRSGPGAPEADPIDPLDPSAGLREARPVEGRPVPVGPGPETAFVGREDLFAVLAQAVRSARAGTGRLVLVKGMSGIGKSRAAPRVPRACRAWSGRCAGGRLGCTGRGSPSAVAADAPVGPGDRLQSFGQRPNCASRVGAP
jgi:hypothetical protein